MCKHLTIGIQFEELLAFSKAELHDEVRLHLTLQRDWLTGYRAEHRASQVSGVEGNFLFFLWEELLETGRDRDLMFKL